MRIISLIVVFLVIFSSISLADVEDEAGILPDNILYGLDKAFEKISLALTFDKTRKIKMKLKIGYKIRHKNGKV